MNIAHRNTGAESEEASEEKNEKMPLPEGSGIFLVTVKKPVINPTRKA